MTSAILKAVDHRPWPIPARPWSIFQSWQNLLFAHYRVPTSMLRKHVPEELTIQEFDGTAWLGVVPFYLEIRPRFSPTLPGISRFPEINVRTYVEYDGKPGVWFMSLDASSHFAVWAARKFFFLPYFHAAIDFKRSGESIHFESQRTRAEDPTAHFRGTYQPLDPLPPAAPGTLEHFLTERYCLYTTDRSDRLIRLDVHHAPWSLYSAQATIEFNSMATPIDIDFGEQQPLLHYADHIDVICWTLERLTNSRSTA